MAVQAVLDKTRTSEMLLNHNPAASPCYATMEALYQLKCPV